MAPRAQQQRGRDRRDQLLDCAEQLFFQQGYEASSIAHLMAAAGVSKGAVYHHFKSKEEVLEALCVRLAQASAASVAGIVADHSLPAIDKLNRVFGALRKRKASEWPRYEGAFETLFTAGNAALFHRISMTMSQVMTPLLATVLQEGIDQGSFRIRDAHAVAEMILHLEGSMHSALVSAADVEGGVSGSLGETRVLRRAAQVGIAIDRLLGLPDHTVVFVPPGQEQVRL